MKQITTTIFWNCPEDVDTDNAMNVAVGRLEEVDSRIVIEDHRNEELDNDNPVLLNKSNPLDGETSSFPADRIDY